MSGRHAARSRWLALGVALPTILLGAGWLAASLRERASRLREEEARLEGIAAAIRGAIDEGLEDLRRREDERPFYLYNHYYSPPEVLAISDPVAVSPLAGGSSDPRVIGWFQIDPDGTVRTPWTVDPAEEGPAEAVQVRAIARGDALADLRALVRGREAGPLVARARPSAPPQILIADARGAARRQTRVPEAAGAADDPLPIALNSYTVELANEIQQAQAGDVEAWDRVARRGRQAPVTTRRSVDLGEIQQQQAAPPRARARSDDPVRAPGELEGAPGAISPAGRDAIGARAPGDERTPSDDAPPLVPTSIEVDYTPMAWREAHGAIVLSRVVSYEGAAVAQGVALDRRAIAARWVPDVVARIAAGGPAPRVIDPDPRAGESASAGACALRAPASETLRGIGLELELCFEPAALATHRDALDAEMRFQIGALLGLVLAVAAAAWAIQRASRRAEELARERSTFVSAVSHELRTPLTTIRMHAEMLEDGLVEEARRPKVYREIASESVRLSRLVENVLEVARLEEGRRPLRRARGDLRVHVGEIVAAQAPFARAKGSTLSVAEHEGGADPIELEYDAQAIEQIVVNGIDNAVKYAPGAIEVDVRREAERAVVRVLDRGPGVPEGERARVFERFHRVPRPQSAHQPGTGIGLALVRDLARAHGGEAQIRAREGGGCELRVELPM